MCVSDDVSGIGYNDGMLTGTKTEVNGPLTVHLTSYILYTCTLVIYDMFGIGWRDDMPTVTEAEVSGPCNVNLSSHIPGFLRAKLIGL